MKGIRSYVLCIASILFLSSCQHSQKLTDSDINRIKQEVLSVQRKITRAAENKDADAMFQYILDSDETIIQTDDVIQTRQEALESVRESFSRFAKIRYDFTEKHVTVLSPTDVEMVTRGQVNDVLNDGRAINFPFMQVVHYVLTDDGWKILYAHHIVENQ